jgi:hypothetical protein
MSETALVPVPRKRPVALLVFLLVSTVLGVFLLIASFLPLMFSPMLFDAGGSPAAWTIFIGVWLFPVMLVVGHLIAWIGFAAKAYRAVYVGYAAMLLPPLVVAGGFMLG